MGRSRRGDAHVSGVRTRLATCALVWMGQAPTEAIAFWSEEQSSGFRERGNAQAAQSVVTGRQKTVFFFGVLDVTYREDRSHARKIGVIPFVVHVIRR